MKPANAIKKGKSAEREVVAMLGQVVSEVYEGRDDMPELFRTGYQQSDDGGSDVGGIPWLACEVKFHKQLSINTWWEQCVGQARKNQTPVLFYKVAHKGWRVRMHGVLHSPTMNNVFATAIVDISPEDFLRYFRKRLLAEIARTK
jgi:hypothetical protein